MPSQRPSNFRIYRANRDNTGSATEWQLSYKPNKEYDPYEMFLVAAKQIGTDDDGNGRFDWKETKMTVKLGDADLGEIISVLERRKEFVGTKGSLFHQTPNGGNKVVDFRAVDNGYSLRVSAQNDKKEKVGDIRQTLSHADASILLVLLKRAVERFYNW